MGHFDEDWRKLPTENPGTCIERRKKAPQER
jgi:hypothetical protein